MKTLALLPLLLAAGACSVEKDGGNDTVTVQYNEQRIRDAASDAGRVAREVGAGVGNVAEETGRAVRNEVGDIDVDVDIRRNRDGEGTRNKLGAGGAVTGVNPVTSVLSPPASLTAQAVRLSRSLRAASAAAMPPAALRSGA